MEFFEYIFDNYLGDLMGISFAYVGIISIFLMFFPFGKIVEFLKAVFSVIISIFKR